MESSEFDYKKYLQLIIRRKELFVALALLIMTGTIIYSYVLPKKYMASCTIFIEKSVIAELVKGIAFTPSMEEPMRALSLALTSRSFLTKVVNSLDMNDYNIKDIKMDEIISKLQGNIQVNVNANNIFRISYVDNDPRLAKDIVNLLAKLYIEQNTKSKRGESYDATKFLAEQIDTFKTKLEKAQDDVNTYKIQKGGVISLDEKSLFQEINTSQQKLYDLELRRRQLEGMRQVTRKSGDPLHAKLGSLQKRLDELLVEYTDSYPEVLKVKGDIETVKAQMKARTGDVYHPLDPQELEKIESEIAALKSSEESIRRNLSINQKLLRDLPSAKAGLEKLETAKDSQKKIYDQLFVRHDQSEMSKQMELEEKSAFFRIAEPATQPKKPISPDRVKIMFIGILGGIAASFGILLLLEQINSTVKDVNFVKGLDTPLLATISLIYNQQEIESQKRRTVQLFSFAGVYLLIALCFPIMELMGNTFVDNALDYLKPTNHVQGTIDRLR